MKNWGKILTTILFVCAAFYFPAQAQTYISGGIYSNTTWTLANSPYIVTDTVVVFPGDTLTIQPGVVVKCDANVLIEVRQGVLVANGTSTQPITFQANSSNAGQAYWIGLNLLNATDTNTMSYCNISNALFAVQSAYRKLIGWNFTNNNVGVCCGIIDSCSFTNNTIAVVNNLYSVNSLKLIRSSIFNSNVVGFYGWSLGLGINCQIQNCSFSNESSVFFGDIQNVTINYCFFNNNQNVFDNGTSGYWYANYSTGAMSQIMSYLVQNFYCYNSYFTNNKNVCNEYSANFNFQGTFNNCVINKNIVGIKIANGIIKNCSFKNNRFAIVEQGSVVSKCIIDSNRVGIEALNNLDSIYCNKIYDDSLYDFEYSGNANAHLGSNAWTDSVIAHIRSKIYDGYVNINLGLVNFLPIDTTQCYLTGCNLQVSANVTNPTCASCNNGSATAIVHNGTAPYTYTWYTSPLQTAATATSLDTGTYTLCVHDANGCNACNNIVVGLGAVNCSGFTISTTHQNATCATCTDGSAKVMATGGTVPYNYTWYTSPLQTTDSAVGLSQGIYHVCVTDHYGCVLCDSATINIGNCSAHFNLLPDTILHHYFAVNMASGAAPLSYSWSWGDGTPNDTGAYPNHTYSSAGFYTICLTIIDAVSCQNTYCDSFYLLRSKNSMITVNVVPAKHATTGIEQLTNSNEQLSIYPNPTTNQLTVVGHQFSVKTIEVRNVVGQIVNCKLVFDNSTDNSKLNTANLSSGIYFLKAIDDKGLQQIVKFVKE